MKRLLVPALALLATLAVVVSGSTAGDDVASGLKVGDRVGAFNVLDCTGPAKGTTLCYRCRYGNRPVVSIFARDVDDNVAQLIKEVDAKVAANESKDMSAFVVLLSDDPDAAEKKLTEVAEKNNIKNVPLTVFDGTAGPPSYKIQKDAGVTVLMWNKGKIESSHGFADGKKLDKQKIKEVVSDTSKILK